MNKEMQKLLKAINDKKNEVKSLVNDGKLDKAKAAKEELKVSTHMPLARHDERGSWSEERQEQFLLTCLLRGMTRNRWIWEHGTSVSTHMPLARHDKR